MGVLPGMPLDTVGSMVYHGIQGIPWDTLGYCGIPWDTVGYHRIRLDDMGYRGIPCYGSFPLGVLQLLVALKLTVHA